MDGLTGKVKFDSQGKRTDFELEIVELKKDGLQKVCKIFKIIKFLVNLYIFVQLFRVEKLVLIKCILKISIQNFYLVVKKQILTINMYLAASNLILFVFKGWCLA